MERGSFGRVIVGAVVSAAVLSGCNVKNGGEDLVNGKKQFVANAPSCHTLARAGASGVTGPNLDEAFQQARKDGMKDSTFAGVVEGQIAHPNRNAQVDPATGKTLPLMKPGIVTGDDARDVAAYVAQAVAAERRRPRPPRLGRRLQGRGHRRSAERDPRHPGRRRPASPTSSPTRRPTPARSRSSPRTRSPTPHDIAVEGNGVDDKGEIVSNGGVSQFEADLKPGEYAFFCSVPGHREGGMEGKLTVK